MRHLSEHTEKLLCRACQILAGLALAGLVLLSGANVLMRLLGSPLSCSYEVSGFLGAALAALMLADTQRVGGHLELNFFLDRYPGKVRTGTALLNCVIATATVLIAGGQLIRRALILRQSHEVSEALNFPFPYLMLLVAGAVMLLAVSFGNAFLRTALKPAAQPQ